jgi:hypothetical protein
MYESNKRREKIQVGVSYPNQNADNIPTPKHAPLVAMTPFPERISQNTTLHPRQKDKNSSQSFIIHN